MRHRLIQTFAVILSNERTNLLPHPNASMTAEVRAVNGEKLNVLFQPKLDLSQGIIDRKRIKHHNHKKKITLFISQFLFSFLIAQDPIVINTYTCILSLLFIYLFIYVWCCWAI